MGRSPTAPKEAPWKALIPAVIKRVLDEAKASRQKPPLGTGEIAVRVAPDLVRRAKPEGESGKEAVEIAPYLKFKTAAWPTEALDMKQGTFRWAGRFWLILKGGR